MNAPLSREHFALEENLTYVNHAAIGVLPIAARDAVTKFATQHAASGVLGIVEYELALAVSRARLGKFVGANADEVAFLGNTSQAANILARGITWTAGDEIIINDNEFGSNALPWLALREQGVVVRMVKTAHERMTPEVLARYINKRTRLVATSWVSFIDGYRHDLPALAEVAHKAGAYFVVDVIQALGAFALDMNGWGIDAIIGGTQKWLLAQPGLGFLCISNKFSEHVEQRLPGWRSLADMWNFLDYDQPLLPGVDRFEAGTPNLIGIAALIASLDILDTVAVEERSAYILRLTDHLVEGLHRCKAHVLTIRSDAESSGIVTFTLPDVDPLALGQRLAAAGIVVTARPVGIRVSPHAYNSLDEIDHILDIISV